MRTRTVILFLVAILLAGGTAMLARSWLAQQRTVEAEAAPMPPPPAQKSVLVARSGFLAAVLRPGMRAVSVPVTATSGISGFVFPGDQVDILITHPLSASGGKGEGVQHQASETVLHDVRVLAVDQKLDNKVSEPVVAQT